MTDAEVIVNVLNGIEPGDGQYTCKACKRKFKSPVEIKHHRADCPGAPGAITYKTSRFKKQEAMNEPGEYPATTGGPVREYPSFRG